MNSLRITSENKIPPHEAGRGSSYSTTARFESELLRGAENNEKVKGPDKPAFEV